MKFDCTGVILAGGSNRRLPGRKKTFRKVGDTIILETIYNIFSKLFDEIILVVNEPREFSTWNMNIVTDIIPKRSALAGLHAGLYYSSNPYAFVTACDTPFIKPEVIEYMISQIESRYEIIIPRTDDGLEPLSAVYSKACIPRIEKNLEDNIFMIKRFFKPKRVKEIPPQKLKELDPEMSFIFNINTQADFETAQTMAMNLSNKNDKHTEG